MSKDKEFTVEEILEKDTQWFKEEFKEKSIVLLDFISDKTRELVGGGGWAMQGCIWECVASVLLGKCLAMLKYKGNADMQDRLIENFINDAKRLADTAQIVKEH
jgi:hypothetical protein